MITKVDERNICAYDYNATVRDGGVTRLETLSEDEQQEEDIKKYILFLREVLQAIKETKGG